MSHGQKHTSQSRDSSLTTGAFVSTSMFVLLSATLLQILHYSICHNKAFQFLLPVLVCPRQLRELQRSESTNRNNCKQFKKIPDFPMLLWPRRNAEQCHFKQTLSPQRPPLHFPLAHAHVYRWMSDYCPGKDQPVCFCSFCSAVESKYLAKTVATY